MINVNIIYQRLLLAGSSEFVAGEWATGFDRAVLRTVRPPLDQCSQRAGQAGLMEGRGRSGPKSWRPGLAFLFRPARGMAGPVQAA